MTSARISAVSSPMAAVGLGLPEEADALRRGQWQLMLFVVGDGQGDRRLALVSQLRAQVLGNLAALAWPDLEAPGERTGDVRRGFGLQHLPADRRGADHEVSTGRDG